MEAIRTLSYSIPVELQGHLDLVHPTVTFPDPHYFPIITPVLGEVGPALSGLGPPLGDIVPTEDKTTHGLREDFGAQTVPSGCQNTITPGLPAGHIQHPDNSCDTNVESSCCCRF